jgi:hypothetical protein
MSSKRIITALALAATAATAAVPAVAHAAGDPTAGGPPREIVGGYAFKESFPPRNTPLIAVVFKATDQLPRRFDGLIRADATLDGSGGSIAGVDGRASRMYTFTVPTLNGRLRADGSPSARIGSRHTLRLTARDGSWSDTFTVTIRAKRPGDRSGAPLR